MSATYVGINLSYGNLTSIMKTSVWKETELCMSSCAQIVGALTLSSMRGTQMKILQGDSREVLRSLKDQSVDCIVTSPPYYALRDYGTGKWVGGDPNCPHRRLSKQSEKTITGHKQDELIGNVGDAIYKKICPLCGAVREDKQIGLEETPEEYIEKMTEVFRECKRVLKDDGTLWINIGDSYWGSGSRGFDFTEYNKTSSFIQKNDRGTENMSNVPSLTGNNGVYKNKDMIGIPWMLAFALRNDGWYLRQDIIWAKNNPMPESVKDRCTKSHEYIFLFSKKQNYYFDYVAIQEDTKSKDEKRNKRDVWKVSTKANSYAHFATYPPELIAPCILAGSRENGIILDPFFGSGTTGEVAMSLGRDFIGIELNSEYIDIAKRRLSEVQTQLTI